MAPSFALASTVGDTRVVLEFVTSDWFTATIQSRGLQAGARVSSFQSTGLGELFRGFARDWRGWPETRQWSSLEGELEIVANSDRTGHVMLEVTLQDSMTPAWSVSANLVLEAGMLEQLAREAEAFEQVAIAT